MLESRAYRAAMLKVPPGPARLKLAKLHRIAKAREQVPRVQLASSTMASPRGDVEALAGTTATVPYESSSWDRFTRDGIMLVDSTVLGERVVVVRDESVQVPPQHADLAVWSLPELRRIRDDLRGGAHRLATFESINRAKRMLGGTLVGTSNGLLAGEIVDVEVPGSPYTTPCSSPARSRHCTSRIPAGGFTAWLQPDAPDGDESRRPDRVPVCSPCAMRHAWSPSARHAQRVWFNEEGPQL